MEALHISSPFYEGNWRGCQAADICEKQAKYIMNKHTVKKSGKKCYIGKGEKYKNTFSEPCGKYIIKAKPILCLNLV